MEFNFDKVFEELKGMEMGSALPRRRVAPYKRSLLETALSTPCCFSLDKK